MNPRRSPHLAALLLGALSFTPALAAQASKTAEPLHQFKEALLELSQASADDCGWDSEAPPTLSPGTAKLENKLFDQADVAVVNALNASVGTPREHISQVLELMQGSSNTINKTWPENRRFQYELLDVAPVFVVKFHIRSRSTFSVFAVAEKTKPEWSRVGGDEHRWDEHNSDESIDLYALARGPNRLARFLEKTAHVSCGDGQTGIEYIGYEWNPSWTGDLRDVLRRKGAVSGEIVPAIGSLQTTGPRVTLPYCWWSSVDSSVWATLCSVDTYDLSRDSVRFVSTKTNRPDLETVAKVIEYAQARDLRAVESYSASSTVAKKLVALMPPFVFNGGAELPKEPKGDRQIVEIEDGQHLRFVLEKRSGHWVVAEFLINAAAQ